MHGDFGAVSVKDLSGNEEKADLYCQGIECERIEIAVDTTDSLALKNAAWRMRGGPLSGSPFHSVTG